MNNFIIKTLTPIHIGSGQELIDNFHYVYFSQRKQVAIIDEAKLLATLGGGKEGLKLMMQLLDKKESLYEYLNQRYKEQLRPEMIAKKVLTVEVKGDGPTYDPKKQTPIREQIKSAHKNCIPGSSLKGALRTAMFVWYVFEESNERIFEDRNSLKDRRGGYSDDRLQQRFLGKDPNYDLFRLVQVGDATFDESICTLVQSMNMYPKKIDFKKDICQYIECIPEGATSTLRIQYNDKLSRAASKRQVEEMSFKGGRKSFKKTYLFDKGKMNDMRLDKMFCFTNQQTKIMIEDELSFWDELSDERGYIMPEEMETYFSVLRNMLEELIPLVDSKNGDTCIVRLGWGTGWLNMTGGWQEDKLEPYLYEELKKIT